MKPLVVVENEKRWPLALEGAEVVSARDYLTDPSFAARRRLAVYNLCRSYAYQTLGYYVSLLANARGHRPLPSVTTIQDLKLASLVRLAGEDVDDLVQRSLRTIRSDHFELSVYFGRNVAKRHDRLAHALFDLFPAPFLRASFERGPGRDASSASTGTGIGTASDGHWQLRGVATIATREIPDEHREFVIARTEEYFARPGRARRRRPTFRYSMAILTDPEEVEPPSDARAIRKLQTAARDLGIETSLIHRDDYARIAEFDALFIREMTAVNHHTYRFARRAEAEGLVVIDDPESIVRCTNKVFQAEAFARHGVPAPRTIVVHARNTHEVVPRIGLPCVLKRPDSSFSQGVVKVSDAAELESCLADFLTRSDLVVAQEFLPSAYDWRIGVLDGRPLYACRYFMAKGHWQIIKTDARSGRRRGGAVDAVPIERVPPAVLDVALRAAALMGMGLYGVDLKELADGRLAIVEVNDNPSIEAGYEDGVLGDELYRSIVLYFRTRLDRRGDAAARPGRDER